MNAAAYRQLIAHCVRDTARGFLPPEDVEDLVQQTLLVLWERKPQCAPEATVTYVRKAARTVTIDELRRRIAQKRDERLNLPFGDVESVLPARTHSPDTRLIEQDALQHLLARWRQFLPTSTLRLLALKYVGGLSSPEAGRIEARSANAIDSLLCRARRRLASEEAS